MFLLSQHLCRHPISELTAPENWQKVFLFQRGNEISDQLRDSRERILTVVTDLLRGQGHSLINHISRSHLTRRDSYSPRVTLSKPHHRP